MAGSSRSDCGYCQNDTGLVFVRCVDCPASIVCLNCFSKGVEFRGHLKTHSYKLIDRGSFSVVDQSWSANEEKLLLDGIEQFGIGNWEDVVQHIGGRTAKAIEEHYYGSYIESVDLGRVTVPHDIPNRVTDHTPPLHESILSVQLPHIGIDKDQELELAYMPLRDDYEMEHDNEAESIISSLVINGEEDELDLDLKVTQVRMYLDKLKERHRRKSVAREYHIVERFFGKQPGLKQDRDNLKRLRHCFQYMREEQALKFGRDSRREQNLKAKIKHLKMYRKNGIKKLEDGAVFDVKLRRRNRSKQNSDMTSELPVPLVEKQSDRLAFEHGHHLLSPEEKMLCRAIRMIPSRYITSKILIIKDVMQKQSGVGIKIRFPSYLEKHQRKKIFNFLSSNGWLPRSSE